MVAPKKPFVIIAAHNEEGHIKGVVARASKYCRDVVIVDDGSVDGTYEEALLTKAHVLSHMTNLGKGAAMKTGAEYALREGAGALVFLDGDGQHRPEEIPLFLKGLERYDLVLGRRPKERGMPLPNRLGRSLTNALIRLLYGVVVHDPLNGYRAMRASAYERVCWSARDYCVEAEMIALAGVEKLKYKEVRTDIVYHDAYKGVTPLHGVPILSSLLLWRITRRKRG